MKRRAEPFWWSLFGAGGVMSAMFLPVLLVFFGFAVPLGWVETPSHGDLTGLLSHWMVRAGLLGVFALSLFHFAHRFRFTLYEGLQLHHLNKTIAVLCYGSAIGLSVYTGYVLFGF